MKASHKDEPIEEKRAKKTSTSKSTKAKSKASTAAADHSYAESPKTKGVKVKYNGNFLGNAFFYMRKKIVVYR